jgi:ABC-type transporter Mla subunit MlaD
VEDIHIKEAEGITLMELDLWVKDKVRLRQGAKAYIKNLGFMGEKYVGLTSGEPNGPYLAPGVLIKGQEPQDFDKLLTEGQVIAKRLKSITINLDERLETNKDHLDEILTNLNLTMQDLASIVSNVDERLTNNEEKIDGTITNLHDLSVNLEELTYDLKLHPWKLLYKEKEKSKKDVEE